MAKRIGQPPDGTSYNKYSPGAGGSDDTHIDQGKRNLPSDKTLREFLDTVLSYSIGTMSPSCFYTVRDASEILGKATVTIRKEARERQIGILKGQGYLFNDHDIFALSSSFAEKEARRRHPLEPPSDKITVARALFERIVQLSDTVDKLAKDRNRFMMMFQTFFNHLTEWQEMITKRVDKLDGR